MKVDPNHQKPVCNPSVQSLGDDISDKELLGDLWDVYYNNKDLRMLLNLLAESSGIASSLRYIFIGVFFGKKCGQL